MVRLKSFSEREREKERTTDLAVMNAGGIRGGITISGHHVILCKLFLHCKDSGGKTSPQQEEMIKCKSWYSKLVSQAKPLRSV